MRNLRAVHRFVTVIVVLFAIYIGSTGVLVELVDLRTIFTHAPATDPNMMAIHAGSYGEGSYRIMSIPDYTATPLSSKDDLSAMFGTVLGAARARVGSAPLRLIELRMVDGKPVGQVSSGGRLLLRFDALTGDFMGNVPPLKPEGALPDSLRNTIKHYHRFDPFNDENWVLWGPAVVGVGLLLLIVTGIWMYFKLYFPRVRMERKNPFWSGGGWWRALHRSISIASAVFITLVTVSGTWLAFDHIYFEHQGRVRRETGQRRAATVTLTPLSDAAIPGMLQTTLNAYHAAMPGNSVRVIQLRNYGGEPQGAIVTGGDDAVQVVYNAMNGHRGIVTAPGAPDSTYPFGAEFHEWLKVFHRGDMIFGLPGRFMNIFAGVAMVYLSISGIAMYWDMWSKRRKAGRSSLFWTT